MNNEHIRLYLTNRYLHGYQIDEKHYEDIKHYLFTYIKGHINGKRLQDLLRNTLVLLIDHVIRIIKLSILLFIYVLVEV